MKKIVIEIADDDYNRINSYPDGKTFYPITARLYKAVKDGTPLEKLIDDIQCKIMHESCYIPDASEAVGMSKAIGIIEKYTKECEE